MKRIKKDILNRVVLFEKAPFKVSVIGHPGEFFFVRKCVGLEEFYTGLKNTGLRYKKNKDIENYYIICENRGNFFNFTGILIPKSYCEKL